MTYKNRTTDINNNINKSQKPRVKLKKPDIKNMYYTIPFIITF